MQLKIFIALSCVIIAACIGTFYSIARRRDEHRGLALTILFAAIVNIGYLGNLLADSYRLMSICNSCYFYAIDLMLIHLICYVDRYTQTKVTPPLRVLRNLAFVYCVMEGVFFIINACQPQGAEWVVTFVRSDSAVLYEYDAHLLFTLHLVFTYLLTAYVIFRLAFRAATVTQAYRRRFTSMLAGILVIVALNAIYLYTASEDMPDISLILYAIMSIVLYIQVYHYSHKGLLSTAGMTMLENMSSPCVMFDNEEHFCLANRAAAFLIPEEKRSSQYLLQDLLHDTGMDKVITDPSRTCAFLWSHPDEAGLTIYRGDLTRMLDKRGKLIGSVISLTDNSLSTDLLTGFFTRNSFERYFSRNAVIAYPASVMILDLNRLAEINDKSGRLAGDQAIRLLSELMRKHLGSDTYFARMGDANLLALCPGMDARSAHEKLDAIRDNLRQTQVDGLPLDMQASVHTVTEAEPDILNAAHLARRSMRIRKLLDHSSAHSSLLDSLARTQMENDPTTESHVRRTQAAGEKLGQRIGLSDVDLSNLSLLCLMHDIGKLGVPLEILNKPGRLTREEWSVMSSHVVKGYNIAMASDELRGVAEYVLHHHESWDGTGYPDHLAGEAIPVLCRIIAVVDAYDAMTNDRPYRRAIPAALARQELRTAAGKQFDPNVVSEYLALLEETEPLEQHENTAATEETIRPVGVQAGKTKAVPNENWIHPVFYARYMLDENGLILSVDDNFTTLTGYSREDLEPYHLMQIDLIPPEDREAYMNRVVDRNEDDLYLEHRLLRKDGAMTNVYCFGRFFYSAGMHAVRTEIIICDASTSMAVHDLVSRMEDSHKRAVAIYQERLREDPLTGLLNQRAFREDVQMVLLDEKRDVLMMILDIDHFKHYNDTLGHHHGDELLRQVGQVLSARQADNIRTCRLGGDEFAVAFFGAKGQENTLSAQADAFWNALRSGARAFDTSMTFSGGTALAGKGMTYLSLFNLADKRLYQAKAAGRDRLIIGDEIK